MTDLGADGSSTSNRAATITDLPAELFSIIAQHLLAPNEVPDPAASFSAHFGYWDEGKRRARRQDVCNLAKAHPRILGPELSRTLRRSDVLSGQNVALSWAIKHNDISLADALLAIHPRISLALIPTAPGYGFHYVEQKTAPALAMAGNFGRVEIGRLLLANFSPPSVRQLRDALFVATFQYQWDFVLMLLEHTDPSPGEGYRGLYLLHRALQSERLDIVEAFLQKGLPDFTHRLSPYPWCSSRDKTLPNRILTETILTMRPDLLDRFISLRASFSRLFPALNAPAAFLKLCSTFPPQGLRHLGTRRADGTLALPAAVVESAITSTAAILTHNRPLMRRSILYLAIAELGAHKCGAPSFCRHVAFSDRPLDLPALHSRLLALAHPARNPPGKHHQNDLCRALCRATQTLNHPALDLLLAHAAALPAPTALAGYVARLHHLFPSPWARRQRSRPGASHVEQTCPIRRGVANFFAPLPDDRAGAAVEEWRARNMTVVVETLRLVRFHLGPVEGLARGRFLWAWTRYLRWEAGRFPAERFAGWGDTGWLDVVVGGKEEEEEDIEEGKAEDEGGGSGGDGGGGSYCRSPIDRAYGAWKGNSVPLDEFVRLCNLIPSHAVGSRIVDGKRRVAGGL